MGIFHAVLQMLHHGHGNIVSFITLDPVVKINVEMNIYQAYQNTIDGHK